MAGTQTKQQTGAPLSVSFRRTVVTLITRFVTETAAWGWDNVPARVLFTRADIPKIAHASAWPPSRNWPGSCR